MGNAYEDGAVKSTAARTCRLGHVNRQVLVALALAVGCGRDAAAPPAPPPPDPRVEAWRADVALLGTELPRRHHDLFFQLPEAEFRAALARLDADLPRLTDDQIVVRLTQLAVTIGDGHTRITAPAGPAYPIRVYWFDDGLHLVAAPADAAWAVGPAITAIGGRPVADALALLSTVAPHDNAMQLRGEAAAALLRPDLVRGLGLANPDGTLALTFADRTLTLAPSTQPPARPPGGDALPITRRAPRMNYWQAHVPEARALVVQYNACYDARPSFAAFVEGLEPLVAGGAIDRVIVDLRNNSGGNSAVFRPFLALVARHPGVAVFALIGRSTFSSAVLNALELEAAGATLVGEIAGGAPTHHGEVKSFTLGHGHTVWYSTKLWANPRHPGRELVPALTVPNTAADHFANRDAALDAALAAPLR